MDTKAAIRAYAIVIMLMVSVSGAALAPFLASMSYQQSPAIEQTPSTDDVKCPSGGTSLTALKTATGYWEQSVDYDWTISKTVDPEASTVDIGFSADFAYTIEVDRTASTKNVYGVYGEINVTNSGSVATQGLKIVDKIMYKTSSMSHFAVLATHIIDLGDYTVLNPGQYHIYSYDYTFEPVAGAVYKNVADITITNHAGYVGTPFGPSPKASFSLPTSPSIVEETDACAVITDEMAAPEHWEITDSTAEFPYTVYGDETISYTVTVKNVDAEKDSVAEMTNTATVTACDSDDEVSDSATVVLTSGGPIFQPKPHMTITKVGPSEALPGETIQWYVTLVNDGNVQLVDIVVTDTLADTPFSVTLTLGVGESEDWYIPYTIPMDITAKTITNTAEASVEIPGADEPYVVAASDTCNILYPSMTVDKSANVAVAMPGDVITYTVRVTNTGNVALEDIVVVDTLAGDIVFPDVPVGEYKEVTYTYTVPSPYTSEDECVDNVVYVTVSGKSEGGFEWQLKGGDEACVDIALPSIDVEKMTKADHACVGDTIYYLIIVTNDGNWALENIEVSDSLIGYIDTIEYLAAGDHVDFEVYFDVTSEFKGDVVTNTATAEADVVGFEYGVSDSDSVEIPVWRPSIDVTKTGPETAEPGDEISYTVTVTNTGNVFLEGIVVDDTLKGLLGYASLAPGASASFTYTYVISEDYDSTVLDNTATATFNLCGEVSESADWSVEIILEEETPMLWIQKCAPCRAMVGELVPFYITVTNTGNTPAYNVTVNDLTIGEIYKLDDVDDDSTYFVGDGSLMPGQVWVIGPIMIEVYDNTHFDKFVNIAEVTGDYHGFDIWCQDSALVDLIHPAILVEKSAPEISALGHTITYTITVYNTGDVSLENVYLVDNVWGSNYACGDDQQDDRTAMPEFYQTERIDIGYLGLGASKTITYTFEVPEEWSYDYVCNGVVAYGQPGPSSLWCGHGACAWFEETNEKRWVSDCDCACTFIVKPSIDVEKTGPCCIDIKGDGRMDFVIKITNTGNYPIEDLHVVDEKAGIDTWIYDVYLAPGAYVTVDAVCYLPDVIESNWFYNHVDVWGDVFGDEHCIVFDDACAKVFIENPSIELIKDVDASNGNMPGDVITFTFLVTNTGNVDLKDIVLEDKLLFDGVKLLSTFDGEDYLAVGASTYFTIDYTIPTEGLTGELYNVATVFGYSLCCEIEVQWSDSVQYFVANPCIEITKTVSDKTSAVLVGDVVHWEIVVHNCGNVALDPVYVYDQLADGENVLIWTGSLAVDEYKTISYDYTVTENSPWCELYYLCNNVNTTGYYGTIEVADSDWSCVFVALPSIEINKYGPEEVCYGDVIDWIVTVENTGNVPLYDVVVADELTGNLWTIDVLAVDEMVYFYPTYDTGAFDLCDPVVNEASVYAEVAIGSGTILEDYATSTVKVAYVDIEVEKCSARIAVRGETITYEITVFNNGNRDVVAYLNDEMLDLVQYEVEVAAGESETLYFEYTIPACYPYECLDNTVFVDAAYKCCVDYAEDSWCVKIVDESVKILKTGPENAVPGETITFQFDVWNDGDVPLSGVTVYDPTLGKSWTLQSDLLPIGDMVVNHWVFTYQYTIPTDYLGDSPCGWLDNHAYVVGYYHGVQCHWADGWSVWIHQPICEDNPEQPA